MIRLNITVFLLIFALTFAGVANSSNYEIEDTVEFPHESCSKELYTSFEFRTFHDARPFYTGDGTLELLVRFRGIADGHIVLTKNSTTTEPLYMIILGSYNNQFSEIRRTKQAQAKVKLSTPGIMSGKVWRGFVVKYNPRFGNLWVFPEGGGLPLLHWKDPEPINVSHYAFTGYRQRLVEVAYDCRPKDTHSSVPKTLGKRIVLFCMLDAYSLYSTGQSW